MVLVAVHPHDELPERLSNLAIAGLVTPAIALIVDKRVGLSESPSTFSFSDCPLALLCRRVDQLAIQLVVDGVDAIDRFAQMPTVDIVGVGKWVIT